MKFLNHLIAKPLIFQRTFGLSRSQFDLLCDLMGLAWEQSEIKKKPAMVEKEVLAVAATINTQV